MHKLIVTVAQPQAIEFWLQKINWDTTGSQFTFSYNSFVHDPAPSTYF